MTATRPVRRGAIAAALLAVYVIWGSTYLAMRFVVVDLPPFLAAGVRFLVAGALLLAWWAWRSPVRPTGAQWKSAAMVGAFLLLGGNGVVMWAEQTEDSGFAALMIATVPLWMVLLQWTRGDRTGLDAWTIAGVVVGLAGVAVLVLDPTGAERPGHGIGTLALLFAAFSWAFGSLLSRRAPASSSPLMMVGLQMVCGGALLLLFGGATGELSRLDVAAASPLAWAALAYLIVFGAMVGYACYIWLLQVTTPAQVSTYAYVNPLVAVLLGVWLADERVGPRTALGALAILLAVIVVVTPRRVLRLRGPRPLVDG